MMHDELKYWRDLSWMIRSGPLLSSAPGLFTPAELSRLATDHEAWLQAQRRDPSRLNEWMKDSEDEILGKVYERLFLFWMNHSPDFNLIAHNVQIQSGGKTRTEVDVIAEHVPTGRVYHIEVSCKYYLGSQNSARHSAWIGPNGHDSLDVRMERMRIQLGIFQSPEGISRLRELGLKSVESKGWLKGYLFLPHDNLAGHALPAGAFRAVPAGWFIRARDKRILQSGMAQWLSLSRIDWISPNELASINNPPMNGNQLVQYLSAHFERSSRAVMIIQADQKGNETTRGFVVPDTWPGTPEIMKSR